MPTKRKTGDLPSDACPFSRPFRPDFDDCPGYLAAEYTAVDMTYRQLAPVATCLHLLVGQDPRRPGRHYGACALGCCEDRLTLESSYGVQSIGKRIPVLNGPQYRQLRNDAVLNATSI